MFPTSYLTRSVTDVGSRGLEDAAAAPPIPTHHVFPVVLPAGHDRGCGLRSAIRSVPGHGCRRGQRVEVVEPELPALRAALPFSSTNPHRFPRAFARRASPPPAYTATEELWPSLRGSSSISSAAPGFEPVDLFGDRSFDNGRKVQVHERLEALELVAELPGCRELDFEAIGRQRLRLRSRSSNVRGLRENGFWLRRAPNSFQTELNDA